MENKTLAYIGLGVALLLLVGTFAMGGGMMSGRSVSDTEGMAGHQGGEGQPVVSSSGDSMVGHHGGEVQPVVSSSGDSMAGHHDGEGQLLSSSSEDLSKYRSEDIPADCRLADYDNDVKKWAEHLSHHENTRYCLEYYKDIGM